MRLSLFTAFTTMCLSVVGATAQDRPTMGMVHNTVEANALTYDCRPVGSELECSFVQTSVRRKAKPEDLAEALRKGRENYPEFKRTSAKECQGYAGLYEAVASNRPPAGADAKKFVESIARLHPSQKADMTKLLERARDMCSDFSEAKFLDFVRTGHERDTRVCKVSSHTFKQRFRQVDTNGPWVVADSPNGPCGVVNVSRFEFEAGSYGGKFWRYLSKKVVTNPRGEMLPGMACSSLDEREYLYDWRSEERFLGCDYVEFGVL
jgi:hypothetical protein